MEGDGVAAEHHELGLRVVPLDEEIAEVLGQDHIRRPGTNRQGTLSRV